MSAYRLFLCVTVILIGAATAFGQPKEALTFGRAIMGALDNGMDSSTALLLTNRDVQQTSCRVLVIFTAATTAQGQTVLFNGRSELNNALEIDIPRGGVRKIKLTTDGGLVEGAVLVAPFLPCDEDSISGNGRFQIQDVDNSLSEFYTIAPNDRSRWVSDGRCVAISTCFRRSADGQGFGNNLGIAMTGVFPGLASPAGTSFETEVYDAEGNVVGTRQSSSFDGSHRASFPLDSFPGVPDGPITLILCLTSPDAGFLVDLTTIQVGTDNNGGFQFDAPDFADGFESGDTTAWSDN